MKETFKRLLKYIPQENPGYIFIKRTKVYIPYKEFGIEILEKTERPLPFIFETILKLIKQEVTKVERMARLKINLKI